MTNEPLLTVASITALVTTVLGLLVAFGVHLTGDQEKAILGIAAVVAPLVVGFIARRKVTPVTTEGN
jgi:ABC-type spermidine/putrescine transport system permease subunit II